MMVKSKLIIIVCIIVLIICSFVEGKPMTINYRLEPLDITAAAIKIKSRRDQNKSTTDNLQSKLDDELDSDKYELTSSQSVRESKNDVNSINDSEQAINRFQYYSMTDRLIKAKIEYLDSLEANGVDIVNLKSTTVPEINNSINQMIVDVNIGSPGQDFKVLIDTGSPLLWVTRSNCAECGGTQNRFNDKQSSTFYDYNDYIELIYGTGFAKGYAGRDKVAFDSSQQSAELNFLLANSVDFDNSDGIFGLAYFNDYGEKFSYMHQLKNNKIIDKLIFSQKYLGSGKGELVIGDYPDEINEKVKSSGNSDFLASCPLVKYLTYPDGTKVRNTHWSCRMHGVFATFDEKNMIKFSETVVFDTGSNHSYISKEFWKILTEKIFKDLIDSAICRTDSEDKALVIKCKVSDKIKDLKAINFVFGQWSFFMYPSEFMTRYGSELHCNLMLMGRGNDSLLGAPFLNLFTSIYNAENDNLELYGKNAFRLDKDYRPSDDDDFYTDRDRRRLIIIISVVAGLIALALIIFLTIKLIKWYKRRQANKAVFRAFNDNDSQPGSNAGNTINYNDDEVRKARERLITYNRI